MTHLYIPNPLLDHTWARNPTTPSLKVVPSASSPHGPPLPLPSPFVSPWQRADRSRDDCRASVEGFPDNVYKGFNSQADATSYIAGYTLAQQHKPEQKKPPEKTYTAQPLQTNHSNENNIRRRDYAKTGSYAELTKEEPMGEERDFEEDERTDEASFWIDTKPSRRAFSPLPGRKRSTPDSMSSDSKRSKLNDYDLEIIDITDSPPKQPVEPTSSSWDSSYSSPYSSKPRTTTTQEAYAQLLTDLFTASTARSSSVPPSVPPIERIEFTMDDCSPEQRQVLDLVSQGKNVFFTGSAGVGKSFVLEKICQLFKSKGRRQFEDFFVTASTGRLPYLSP